MLTDDQKKFLEKIPVDKIANIKPWDPNAADYAINLENEISKKTGLTVFWEGSLALGIPGENDIDFYIFSKPKYFNKYLPAIVNLLGDPTYILQEKVLWRIYKGGYKIDASLISQDSLAVKRDKMFYSLLKENPELLKEYASLKTPGLTAREYYKRKNEFYNKITKDI